MPKEWILNQANMRWGLTKKNKVGAVSDEIRKCSPKALNEMNNPVPKTTIIIGDRRSSNAG